MNARRGFLNRSAATTLVEVLVVIAIIGVVLALTTGAVQRARTTSYRVLCQNQLRQIGLALHLYHDAFKKFPSGMRYRDGKDPMRFLTWMPPLLPYLEQAPRWEETQQAFRLNRNFQKNPPHALGTISLPSFQCPLDARSVIVSDTSGGLTSYLGVNGTRAAFSNGVLYGDSNTRLADITDGAANTLLVGERPASADRQLGWWYAGSGQDNDGEGDCVLGVRTKNNGVYAANCPIGPFVYAAGEIANQCDAFHFWSLHPGGGHFLFGDGAVRFLTYSANDVLPALATRSGGEPNATVP